MRLVLEEVLRFQTQLQKATTVRELLVATLQVVRQLSGYQHVWLLAVHEGPPRVVRSVAVSGGLEAFAWNEARAIPVDGDRLLEEVVAATEPVLVDDARTDPRCNPDVAAEVGNRTILNMPILLEDKRLGVLGTGTFGDEGVRVPTEAQLQQLKLVAALFAAALNRVRVTEERDQLARKLSAVQRIESLALLAGGVAHDFNNLLTIISSNLHLLASRPLTPAQASDVKETLEACHRAGKVTHQLLAIGRKQDLRFEELDVNARVRAVTAMLSRLLGERIQLDFVPAALLPQVLADGGQLDQVVMNLCINARDAMPQGGRLTLETQQVVLNGNFIASHPWARAGRYVLLTVTDTGEGMSPEVLEHIFEPFFTTKAVGRGTGLGLSVAMGIIEQHGGLLHAYSEPGVGTTFKVYLPAHAAKATAVGTLVQGQVPRGSERVLLAEDDAQLRSTVHRVLTAAGYTVVPARDGTEAVQLATDAAFDLVLLDAIMPGLNGREAFERIRLARPATRFLFASGYAADLLPAEFLKQHGLTLLPKPFDPDTLLRAVRQVLDG
jgi:two-component system, cell cycle sensor histidine kinase and response regulator CckA